jgi:hypothetical protein
MLSTTTKAMMILRHADAFEKVGGILGGAAKGLGNIVGAMDQAGQAGAKALASKGHGNLAIAARVAPHLATLYAGKKLYESGPVQGIRGKIQEMRYNRAVRRAQRQQGY